MYANRGEIKTGKIIVEYARRRYLSAFRRINNKHVSEMYNASCTGGGKKQQYPKRQERERERQREKKTLIILLYTYVHARNGAQNAFSVYRVQCVHVEFGPPTTACVCVCVC